MPGFRAIRRAPLIAACGLLLASCGGSDDGISIPEDQGRSLLSQLETVANAVDQGDCPTALGAARSFSTTASELDPEQVGAEARDALVDASLNLVELAETECEPETGASGEEGALEDEATAPPPPPEPPPEPEQEPEEQPEDTGEPPPGQSGNPGNSDGNPGGGNSNSGGGNSGGGSGEEPPSGGIEG